MRPVASLRSYVSAVLNIELGSGGGRSGRLGLIGTVAGTSGPTNSSRRLKGIAISTARLRYHSSYLLSPSVPRISRTRQVVYVSPKDNFLYLYVTDYTARPDLVMVSPSMVTPTASADRILRITLHDSQVETAKNLEVGDIISIRKLRLRPTGEGNLYGRLGGDERLIMKLNPNSTKNAELRALLRYVGRPGNALAFRNSPRCRRREELQAARSRPKPNRKAKGDRAARKSQATEAIRRDTPLPEPSAKGKGKGKATVKSTQYAPLAEVKASDTCPGVFRVKARVVDFFPDDLRDCTLLRCTSCGDTCVPTSSLLLEPVVDDCEDRLQYPEDTADVHQVRRRDGR